MSTALPVPDRRWQEMFRVAVDLAGEAVLLVDVASGTCIDFNEAAHGNLG